MLAEGAPIYNDTVLDPGMYLDWSQTALVHLLHINSSRADEPNEGGSVVRVTFGLVNLLLTGDIACDTEDEILARAYNLEAEVLKVAHHGSRFSSCDPFLDAVSAQIGVISVGENTHGHPTDEALGRLQAHGLELYRTDLHGDVNVTTDGRNVTVTTERGPSAGE